MTIKRDDINKIYRTLEKLKENENISLTNKYYILKIISELKKEIEITYSLFSEISNRYGEETEKGIKIKEEYVDLVAKQIMEFNSRDVIIPDIYFTLDSFEDCNLTWEQLEALMPFIKN